MYLVLRKGQFGRPVGGYLRSRQQLYVKVVGFENAGSRPPHCLRISKARRKVGLFPSIAGRQSSHEGSVVLQFRCARVYTNALH